MSLVTRARPLVGALSLAFAALTLVPAPAQADGPGVGTPYVVSVGDSYISGEAGRWAGSSNDSASRADALGGTAYFDNAVEHRRADQPVPPQQERRDPHRRRRATASTSPAPAPGPRPSDGSDFKPGLDFYDNGAGKQGQAKMLQQFAATHNVKMVAVSIGGNDFNFASDRAVVRDGLPLLAVVVARTTARTTAASSPTSRPANVAAVKTRIANALPQRPDRDAQRRLCRQLVDPAGAELPVADPQRLRHPLQPERLHAPEHRRLRVLERRRRLGQRHRAADDQQHRHRRDQPGRASRTPRRSTWRRRSTAGGSARAVSACTRRSAWPTGRRRRRSTAPSGSTRSAR